MAFRFMDSFDHYATASMGDKWTSVSNPEINSAYSRFAGGQGLRMNQLTSQRNVVKVIDAQATWVFGFALKIEGYGTVDFFRLIDSSTTQLSLRMTSGGLIQLSRGSSGAAILGTGTLVFQPLVWYYVELKVTINDTTGAYEVRVDGASQFSGTSADTQATANASADRFQFLGSGDDNSSGPKQFDDLYVLDGTGGSNDDFLGDLRIQAIYPNGNGNSSQLVGSDGNSTDNYLLVDETQPNDADYVESSTPGDKDTYTYGNLTPTAGSVYAVQPIPRAAKTDAGTREIVSVARLSGTEEDGPVQTLSASVQYLYDIRSTKPGGGSWSITDVNNAEFGIKVNA